jgi:hypothetical protein
MDSVDPNIDRPLAARINLYYDLHVATAGPAPLLIALHGYGASKRCRGFINTLKSRGSRVGHCGLGLGG